MIESGDHQVEVRRRRGQRHMNLSVKADGRVRVSCNLRRSQREIRAFVVSCQEFIARRRRELADLEKRHPTLKLLSGEKILWRGDEIFIDVIWSWQKRLRVNLIENRLEILAPINSTFADRQKALLRFFRAMAEIDLSRRVEEWGRRMGLPSRSLTVRGQKTLWGSCTGAGDISLNWKLMCAPSAVIDYVVIHELAHIPERNHSSRFWNLVAQFSPDHLSHRAWLRAHEPRIARFFLDV